MATGMLTSGSVTQHPGVFTRTLSVCVRSSSAPFTPGPAVPRTLSMNGLSARSLSSMARSTWTLSCAPAPFTDLSGSSPPGSSRALTRSRATCSDALSTRCSARQVVRSCSSMSMKSILAIERFSTATLTPSSVPGLAIASARAPMTTAPRAKHRHCRTGCTRGSANTCAGPASAAGAPCASGWARTTRSAAWVLVKDSAPLRDRRALTR
mmetsp:Transcript_21891/g.56314  ORF Transcript_21891/g.56314 Transcript_21891/m.56314 type:complete len:210 (-) Transcript_21891:474-1103(-)